MVKNTCIICKQEKDKISKGMCPSCYTTEYKKTHRNKTYEGKCNNCGKIKKYVYRGLCPSCHRTKNNIERQLLAPLIKCQCSDECQEMIPNITMEGKPTKYKQGHLRRGKNNNMYKYGWFIRNGYKYLTGYYGHFNANKRGEILEHVLIMSNHLNRHLFKDEVVHHINGDKLDNRIENLQLTNRSLHQNIHNPRKDYRKDMTGIICLDCGAETTYPSKNGQPHWCLHPITGEEYVCEKCYKRLKLGIQNKVSYRRKDFSGRICLKCGAQNSESRSGQSTWKSYENGWICKRCYDKIIREKRSRST